MEAVTTVNESSLLEFPTMIFFTFTLDELLLMLVCLSDIVMVALNLDREERDPALPVELRL